MRVMMVGCALAVTLVCGLGAAAQPAANSAQADNARGDEIVVTGERLRSVLRDFVGEVSTPSAGENQLARWDHRICTGVFGMTNRDQAQFIADRIAQRAFAAGLDAGQAGCRANVAIFVTPDAPALAHALATNYRSLLAVRHERNVGTQGDVALQAFVNSDRPVRWWHVTETVSADGFRVNAANDHQAFNGDGSSMSMGTQVHVFSPSRLRQAVRQDFNRVIIVVDARRSAGKRLDALADYLAMVSLAQLSPQIDAASYPSVLNLFGNNGPQAVTGMTSFDVSYLDGLYHATRDARNARQQEGEIADRMDRTLNGTQTAQQPAQPGP